MSTRRQEMSVRTCAHLGVQLCGPLAELRNARLHRHRARLPLSGALLDGRSICLVAVTGSW